MIDTIGIEHLSAETIEGNGHRTHELEERILAATAKLGEAQVALEAVAPSTAATAVHASDLPRPDEISPTMTTERAMELFRALNCEVTYDPDRKSGGRPHKTFKVKLPMECVVRIEGKTKTYNKLEQAADACRAILRNNKPVGGTRELSQRCVAALRTLLEAHHASPGTKQLELDLQPENIPESNAEAATRGCIPGPTTDPLGDS